MYRILNPSPLPPSLVGMVFDDSITIITIALNLEGQNDSLKHLIAYLLPRRTYTSISVC